jgi:hypothetical protein
MSDIYKEFGVDFLRTRYAGPTAAEMKMAQEITRLRAGLQKIVEGDGFWDAPSLARDLLEGKDVT